MLVVIIVFTFPERPSDVREINHQKCVHYPTSTVLTSSHKKKLMQIRFQLFSIVAQISAGDRYDCYLRSNLSKLAVSPALNLLMQLARIKTRHASAHENLAPFEKREGMIFKQR